MRGSSRTPPIREGGRTPSGRGSAGILLFGLRTRESYSFLSCARFRSVASVVVFSIRFVFEVVVHECHRAPQDGGQVMLTVLGIVPLPHPEFPGVPHERRKDAPPLHTLF